MRSAQLNNVSAMFEQYSNNMWTILDQYLNNIWRKSQQRLHNIWKMLKGCCGPSGCRQTNANGSSVGVHRSRVRKHARNSPNACQAGSPVVALVAAHTRASRAARRARRVTPSVHPAPSPNRAIAGNRDTREKLINIYSTCITETESSARPAARVRTGSTWSALLTPPK